MMRLGRYGLYFKFSKFWGFVWTFFIALLTITSISQVWAMKGITLAPDDAQLMGLLGLYLVLWPFAQLFGIRKYKTTREALRDLRRCAKEDAEIIADLEKELEGEE